MRSRRLPSIGLRTRTIAALVLTAAATLAVAALALLSPLEHRLRNQEVKSLTQNALAAEPTLHELGESQLRPRSRELNHFARVLERRTGARVIVFDHTGKVLVDTDPDADLNGPEGGPFNDVQAALATGKRRHSITEAGPGGGAHVALPVDVGGQRLVIALRRSLEQSHAAVAVVRRAFLTAAVVGLGLALVLGIALATTLLRRLRMLRDAAGRIAEEGLQPEVPGETDRDEVGELARALAGMQERLRHQENARRAFVATASHELRTPLASLDAMLELLADDLETKPPDLEDAGPRVTAARNQTRRLIALANDLLELTRLDTGFDLRTELVELRELSRAVIAEFAIRAADREVPIDLRGEAPCWVLGDPDSIARIARILLDNALRFAPAGERVILTVSQSGASGVLAVTDRGPGVPEDERELVFERFRRGSEAGDEGGFGLGLAIGRELADRMSGTLTLAETESGSRFELRLRSAPSPLEEAPAADRVRAG